MMRRIAFAATALVMTVALAAPGALAKKHGDEYKEESHQTFDAGARGSLSLTNVNGDVTITGYDGKSIEIDAVKFASSQDRLDDVTIKSSMKDGHVVIDVDMGDDHRYNHGNAGVEFTIRVPHGTRIDEVELVNGDLRMKDVNARVEASSVNGDVSAEKLSGEVSLSAVNGDVSLTVVGKVDAIKLHSVNGTVELVVPRDADARVSASTVHGSIRGTGNIKSERNFVGSSLTSVLGEGKGKIQIDTVNGNIRIYHDGEERG